MSRGKVVPITEALVKLDDFSLFWECYPRKKAKLDAMKAWQQTSTVRPPIEQIIAACETLSKQHDWRSDPNGQFLPYPATWLRRGQFLDED